MLASSLLLSISPKSWLFPTPALSAPYAQTVPFSLAVLLLPILIPPASFAPLIPILSSSFIL